jgi:hypothetical protein
MAKNFIGLTASLVNNDPAEVASLLTVAEGRRFVSPGQFRRMYTRRVGSAPGFFGGKKEVKGLKNIDHMMSWVYPEVDYVESSDLKGKSMPRKELRSVAVPMSDEQYELYQAALDRLGPIKDYIVRNRANVSLRDANQIFTQLMMARQISNSLHTVRTDLDPAQSAKMTPKTKQVLEDTMLHLKASPDNKVVLYSNLVRGGVDTLVAGLKAQGIDPAIFVGKGRQIGDKKVTSETRSSGVNDFKAGNKRVIVLSGAGAEGLSLNNATAFYSLDGHFNPEKILQAEARARRLGGQSHREPNKRVVDVRRYKSVIPQSKRPGVISRMMGRKAPNTVDEWVYSVAKSKYHTNKEFYRALKQPKYKRKYVNSRGNTIYVYDRKKK